MQMAEGYQFLMVCLYVSTGLSLLKKVNGQICRACHRFFINVEDAKTHCRTLMHYNNFVALVKEKVNTHSFLQLAVTLWKESSVY
jgi:UDP-N-acetylmuramyl pentapeptide synthase